MNQKSIYSFPFLWDFRILLFFILPLEKSYGDDRYFEACEPKDCGNGLEIRFPFYIPGLQESFCGFPKFEMNCSSDGNPIIHTPDNDYVVEQIFYQNRSLRLYNTAVKNMTNCAHQIRNVTLPDQFSFSTEASSELHLLSNCSENLLEQLSDYNNFEGASGNICGFEIAMLGNDGNLSSALGECKTNVVAPVEAGELIGGNAEDYVRLLRRGFLLNWAASDCNSCEQSGGRCGFNASSFHFKCYCPDRPHVWTCKPVLRAGKNRTGLILGTAVAGSAFLLISVSLGLLILWHKRRTKNASFFSSRSISSTKPDLEVGSVYCGIPVFSYGELEEVTNNFDSSKELGDGGFGAVYYGKLRDGREVAVKRLYEHNIKRMEQFMNEIKILTRLKHPNLVTLYGCTSRRSRELLLVYEFIPNGTVADHLHGERASHGSLKWPLRMKIAIQTANALAYLHASDIIHRDVKTNNILLDHNFSVKVADFGLSRLFPNDVTHVSTAPQGTPGYVDPEYHQCYQLTNRSDVYSFGVVLVELISSMPAVDISRHHHEINLANLAINRIQRCAFDELIDPFLGFESDPEVMRMTTSVAELAFRCLQNEKEMRPTMDEVLNTLKHIKDYKDNSGEKTDKANENGKASESRIEMVVPASADSQDVILPKNHTKLPPSPISVTDTWVSSSSANSTNS